MSQFLPVKNSTVSFWLQNEAEDLKNFRSSTSLPKSVDTLIIGSGYAGTTTAYYLMKGDNANNSILMLEARNICSGATGRNGGHLKPDLYYAYEAFTEKYGDKLTADIFNFEFDHTKELKELIETENIDCDFVLTRSCDTHLDQSSIDKAVNGYNKVKNNPYVKYLHDLQINFGDEAKIISKVPESPVCITYTAGHLYPYKLVTSLLRKCIAKGLQVHANTPVMKIEKLEDGEYLVKTPRGDIKTKKLIIATNAYTASVEPKFENKITPVKGVCTRITSADPDNYTPHLTNTYSLRNTANAFDYLINRGDGSVIVGGGRYVLYGKEHLFNNVVDDSTLIPGLKEYFTNYMKERFYTWKNFDEKLDTIWSGIMGFTDDTLPYVGEVPGDENKFIIAGFHGHGMPRVLLCAKALAKVINSETDCLQVPDPFKITPSRMNNSTDTTPDPVSAKSKL